MSTKTSPRLNPSDTYIDSAVQALAALVLAMERTSDGRAAANYRAAIRRHGQALAARGGLEAMQTVLERVGDLSPAHAAARRAVIVSTWAGHGSRVR
jgi:hypothetical protein